MKNKKILSLVIVLAIISTALFTSSCSLFTPPAVGAGSVTLVLAKDENNIKEYTVEFEDGEITNGFISVLEICKAQGMIDYQITGTMIDFVKDSVDENIYVGNDYAASSYLWIYTSVEKDVSVASLFDVEYKGITLKSSDLGINEMSVEDGAVFYIGTIIWA
jgi:hypothetical protein